MMHWWIIWTKISAFVCVYFREEKQIEQGKEYWDYWEGGVGILGGVTSVGLAEKITFKQRLERGKGVKAMEISRRKTSYA